MSVSEPVSEVAPDALSDALPDVLPELSREPFAGLSRTLIDLALVLLAVLAMTIPGIGGGEKMSSTMEIGFALTVQDDARGDHWLVPMQNGRPRVVKPPLPFWIAQAAVEIGGFENGRTPVWLIRLCSAGAGLAGAWFVYAMGRTMFSRSAGLWAGITWATCMHIVREMRYARHDIYFSAGIALMMLGIWMLWDRKRFAWIVTAIGIFLAMQVKGPVLFFVGLLPAMGFWWWFDRDQGARRWTLPKRWPTLLGLLGLVLACGIPLAIWASNVNANVRDDLADDYVWETVGRFASSKVEFDSPVYYGAYIAYLLPWTPLLVAGIWYLIKKETTPKVRMATWFCLWWLVGAIVLMSLPKEKTGRYAAPFVAPGCLIIGWWIARFTAGLSESKLGEKLRDGGITGVLITLYVAAVAVPIAVHNRDWAGWTPLIAAGVGVAVVTSVSIYFFRTKREAIGLGLCALAMAVAMNTYQIADETGRPPESFRADAHRIAELAEGETIYWADQRSGPHYLAYMLNDVVPRIDDPIARRAAGVESERRRLSPARVMKGLMQRGGGVVVVNQRDLDELRADNVEFDVLATDLIPYVPGEQGENRSRALIRLKKAPPTTQPDA